MGTCRLSRDHSQAAAGVYLLVCRQSKSNISDYKDLVSLGKLLLDAGDGRVEAF